MHTDRRLLSVMFCVGLAAILAQVLVLREMLVAFFGNELTIGAILSAWMVGIGLGSLAVRPVLGRLSAARLSWLLTCLLILLAAVIPAQVAVTRVVRAILQVPFGEYVPFGTMLVSAVAILFPACFIIGVLFPAVCHLAAGGDRRAVSRVYAVESLGSMLGGVLFSFVFVYCMTPFMIAAAAGVCALVGAAIAAPRRAARRILLLPILGLSILAACPRCVGWIEWRSVEARWRAFGCLPAPPAAEPPARLMAAVDSRYQNLALIEASGQNTLYGNGQVLFVFPDEIGGEHRIHFIMAQKPDAKNVLLVGGNPVTDVPELLKYPLDNLVHVDLDQAIFTLLSAAGGPGYKQALRDPRFRQVSTDGPRFVKTTRSAFDVVMVEAPEPATLALNRFYTREFYADVRRILAPGGFLQTSIETSELLQDEPAGLCASIYRSLKEVFDVVLVTAGTRNRFFAGMTGTPLTFDRQILFQRIAGARPATRYFRPEYCLNADEIAPDKIEFMDRRMAEVRAPANTTLKPVSAFYQLTLWSQYSGSRLDACLRLLRRLDLRLITGMVLGCGMLCLLIAAIWRCLRRGTAPVGMSDSQRGWSRWMVALVIAATGCYGMALEIVLIFIFQSGFGYVYAQMGFIVAMFMLGLMLGAMGVARVAGAAAARLWMIGINLLMLAVAAVIPGMVARLAGWNGLPATGVLYETLIYGLIVFTGVAVGAQFTLANRLICALGGVTGATAAMTNAADLVGAALGGFAMGVLFLPLFGIQAACALLVALTGSGVLCLCATFLPESSCPADGE